MSTHIDLASWSVLSDLGDQLDAGGDDLAAIAGYARRWMCQGEGFEPSPLCLLRPLARVLDVVAETFHDLERLGVGDLLAVRDAVTATASDLALVDLLAATRLPAVA
ncbi:hypothetical protein ACFQ0K_14510 [Nocardioides caeni]|uniref:Uncharacterized protein n=1 Tax=Nocardioides caeni TaxID=574700 RepID=A0A4S8NET3_9ACTN|nr:hypothetical protein [Nocardioides caeni]THV14591.1 hypothetical protein E9934_07935 [Nocardioides caeni]